MKKYKLNIEADREKLRQAFEKNLPEHSSDIEVGACYGYINENEIRIFTKKASRSYKILAHDMLIAKIDESGNIEYTFKRDTKSVIFTIIAPMRRPAWLLVANGGAVWEVKQGQRGHTPTSVNLRDFIAEESRTHKVFIGKYPYTLQKKSS